MKEIDIQTNNKSEMIEITSIVQKAVSKEKVATGICVIFAPHTTAAITINENADPDVPRTRKILINVICENGNINCF